MKDELKNIDKEVRDLEHAVVDSSQVVGWGIDANPENDPVYPMKTRNNGEHRGYAWERPPQQPLTVEVLHSNERPNYAATFGTANPPTGLSGIIRRGAFKYSENSYGHWLPLMLADRIGVVEGVVEDLTRGHIPNIFSELGLKAEWQHNRPRLVRRIAIGAAITSIAILFLRNRKKKDDSI